MWLRLLCPLALVCGVLLMHGVQASSSPVDASGVAVQAMDHAAGGADHRVPDHGGDHHPGGQVCLAFLSIIVIGMAVLALVRWRLPAMTREARDRIWRAGFHTGRSPPCPTPFQLAVLRL